MNGSYPVTGRLHEALKMTEGLAFIARELARAARKHSPQRPRLPRGATLRPGPHTPMWNALVLAARPHLRRYGAKSNLARYLNVPPQRVHDYLQARTAAPDAERTLLLLHWLAGRAKPSRADPGRQAPADQSDGPSRPAGTFT